MEREEEEGEREGSQEGWNEQGWQQGCVTCSGEEGRERQLAIAEQVTCNST